MIEYLQFLDSLFFSNNQIENFDLPPYDNINNMLLPHKGIIDEYIKKHNINKLELYSVISLFDKDASLLEIEDVRLRIKYLHILLNVINEDFKKVKDMISHNTVLKQQYNNILLSKKLILRIVRFFIAEAMNIDNLIIKDNNSINHNNIKQNNLPFHKTFFHMNNQHNNNSSNSSEPLVSSHESFSMHHHHNHSSKSASQSNSTPLLETSNDTFSMYHHPHHRHQHYKNYASNSASQSNMASQSNSASQSDLPPQSNSASQSDSTSQSNSGSQSDSTSQSNSGSQSNSMPRSKKIHRYKYEHKEIKDNKLQNIFFSTILILIIIYFNYKK